MAHLPKLGLYLLNYMNSKRKNITRLGKSKHPYSCTESCALHMRYFKDTVHNEFNDGKVNISQQATKHMNTNSMNLMCNQC